MINVSPTQIYLQIPGDFLPYSSLLAENGRCVKSHLKHSEKERSDPLASIIRDVLGWEKTLISQQSKDVGPRTATNTTKKHFSGGYPRGTSKKTSISNCPWPQLDRFFMVQQLQLFQQNPTKLSRMPCHCRTTNCTTQGVLSQD